MEFFFASLFLPVCLFFVVNFFDPTDKLSLLLLLLFFFFFLKLVLYVFRSSESERPGSELVVDEEKDVTELEKETEKESESAAVKETVPAVPEEEQDSQEQVLPYVQEILSTYILSVYFEI